MPYRDRVEELGAWWKRRRAMNSLYLAALLTTSAAITSAAASAQETATARPDQRNIAVELTSLDEIIVTAQKRTESLQDVPLAISALSGDTMSDRGITDVASLAQAVPSLTFGSYGGQARIAIRGIGFDTINPGGEGRVAYHLNGVYLSHPAATIGTFFDVERVEVLRGPQGTLYGRNATGGSINVIPRGPSDEFEGYLTLGYGNYDAITTEGAVGGPIANGVAFRVGFMTEDHDGYGRNIITGTRIDNTKRRGARGMLSFRLGDSAKLDLSADYFNENDRNYGNHFLGRANPNVTPTGLLVGGIVPTDRREIANDFDPKNDRTFWGLSARLAVEFGDVTLTSITGYRNNDYSLLTDLDATSAPISRFVFAEKGDHFSQELQLAGEFGRLSFLVGGYYFQEKVDGNVSIPFNRLVIGLPSLMVQGYAVQGDLRTKAIAGFGQASYTLTDKLKATLGLRYSWERHSIADQFQFDVGRPFVPGAPIIPAATRNARRSENAFAPKFGLEFTPRKDLLYYVSVSKGFKSGGYNLGDIVDPNTGLTNNGFTPETLWSYDAGFRGSFAGGLIDLNANAFYYDYKNLQVSKVVLSTVIIENAASSQIYGLEAQAIVRPLPGLQLEVTPTWLNGRYKDFRSANPADPFNPTPVVLDGKQITQSPELALNLAAQYTMDVGAGRFRLRGEMAFQDRIFFTPFNERDVSRAPNTMFNAFATYTTDSWELSLFARNLTNRTVIANALVNSGLIGLPITGTLYPPRTYGIKVGYRFGG
jgi:iron complex outermembrane recepter protein